MSILPFLERQTAPYSAKSTI